MIPKIEVYQAILAAAAAVAIGLGCGWLAFEALTKWGWLP